MNFSPENLGFLGIGKANYTNLFSPKVGKKWGGLLINEKIIDYQSYSELLLIIGTTLGKSVKKGDLGSFAFMFYSRDCKLSPSLSETGKNEAEMMGKSCLLEEKKMLH